MYQLRGLILRDITVLLYSQYSLKMTIVMPKQVWVKLWILCRVPVCAFCWHIRKIFKPSLCVCVGGFLFVCLSIFTNHHNVWLYAVRL